MALIPKTLALLLLFFSFHFVSPPSSLADNSSELEYAIKAGLINNFAKFIEWPKEAFAGGPELIIGVVGEDPFGNHLQAMARENKPRGRDYLFKRFRSPEDIRECHILFVGASEKNNLGKILEAVKDRHVLIIGDAPGFAEMGVGINFIIDRGRIWFECNAQAMERAGLTVSSYLLSIGKAARK